MREKYAVVCATILVVLLSAGEAAAAGVVFRYLPGATSFSSSVESRQVEPGPYLDPRERVARGPGGWGYDPAWAGEFEAPGSMLWEAATEDVNQPFGPNVTAEVWVRLLTVDSHTLLTNRVGAGDGFTLGLTNGVPYFEIVIQGQSHRVDGLSAVVAGTDVWLAATTEYATSGNLELTLYRDGRIEKRAAVSRSIATPYVVRHPLYVGTEVTGTDESPVLTGTITGLVYAAVVRDYVAADDYLNTPPPFDGSTYFGLPNFHDYEPGSFHLPMDQRIDSYPVPLKRKVVLPHVNDEFIPQGTAVASDEESGEAELIYVAYYHRTRDDRLRVQRSIVAEIEASTGAVRRTFRLTGRLEDSHAGGIALAGGALFVSSSGYLERYPIPSFDSAAPRYLDLAADTDGSAPVLSKSSFVSTFADTLWVGDYRTASEQQPYLYGYPIDPSGQLIPGADPVIYPIPRRIQGVDFFTARGTTYVFMSRNRNSTEGEVLRFRRSDLDPYSVPAWEASITFPHGIEDLSFADDGTLWSNSESGTVFYQRTAEWSSFYPYAFGVESTGVVPTSTAVGALPVSSLRIEAYPNPASDVVTVRFILDRAMHARVLLIDSVGRRVVTFVDRTMAGGTHSLRWNTHGLAQGVYLVVVEAGERRKYQPITLVR